MTVFTQYHKIIIFDYLEGFFKRFSEKILKWVNFIGLWLHVNTIMLVYSLHGRLSPYSNNAVSYDTLPDGGGEIWKD